MRTRHCFSLSDSLDASREIRRRLEGLFGIVLVLLSLCAEASVESEVDEYVRTEMQWCSTVGLALAVMQEGCIASVRCYGLANIEHQVPVKPETVFKSASVAKQFTATAVMMLVEDGKISLADKITKFFTNAPESWNGISVRHLLTHTSGMGFFPQDEDYTRTCTEEELLTKIMTIPLEFPPGEKHAYSNLGYVTLGLLIGKVTGGSYGDFLQARVFKPLGMSTARVISDAAIVTNRAAGYRFLNNKWENIPAWYPPIFSTTADGGLLLSVYDMAKWDAALYTEKLLKKSSLNEMWAPVETVDGKTHPYGFGWELGSVNGHPIVEHSGGVVGFKSHIARYPNQKLTVVVFANSWVVPGKIAHRVASIYCPELAPPVPVPIEDKEPSLTLLVRTLVQGLIEGKVNPELFTPEAPRDYLSSIRAKELGERLKSLGELDSIELISRTDYDTFGGRGVDYRLIFRKLVVICRLGVNKENQIFWRSILPE
jgi:CubicO group peptidase (beta-lactamase class C family)